MIEFLSSGTYSTIQDLGRRGYRQYGVPVSGAMDQYAARLANQLLGNQDNTPLIEITMTGPELKFMVPCYFVITGANFDARLDDETIENNSIAYAKMGQQLKIGIAKSGVRGYLAIAGGIDADLVMGSASQFPGITKTRRLVKGDKVRFKHNNANVSHKHSNVKSRFVETNAVIDVLKGPEFDHLTKTMQNDVLNSLFTISNQSNRMGYRLMSSEVLSASEIITSPVLPGTVQLTPSGQMIILGRDAQTTGGYARILQLTDSAQNILAQIPFGSQIQFRLI